MKDLFLHRLLARTFSQVKTKPKTLYRLWRSINWKYIIFVSRFHMLIQFFFNFWKTPVLFMWPLIPMFRISGGVCPGFQSQRGSPRLCALSPAHIGILRFTSGATPADLLAASMACWFKYYNTHFLHWKLIDLLPFTFCGYYSLVVSILPGIMNQTGNTLKEHPWILTNARVSKESDLVS